MSSLIWPAMIETQLFPRGENIHKQTFLEKDVIRARVYLCQGEVMLRLEYSECSPVQIRVHPPYVISEVTGAVLWSTKQAPGYVAPQDLNLQSVWYHDDRQR
jgi:hypothetical protein